MIYFTDCHNPNRNPGYCLSIYDCPSLYDLLKTTTSLTIDERNFVRESQCDNGFGRMPFVCCTQDKNYARLSTTTTTTTTRRPQPIPSNEGNGQGESLLPREPACGPSSFLDRIYNGNDTALDDFVWMALLMYRERKLIALKWN